jgi:hypothetical protein
VQRDLPCAPTGDSGGAASQQFSSDVPSALAVQFVAVHHSSEADDANHLYPAALADSAAMRTLLNPFRAALANTSLTSVRTEVKDVGLSSVLILM